MVSSVARGSDAIKRFLRYIALSLAIFGLDILTKQLVATHLQGRPPWPEGWDFLYFHYAENYHMIFSWTFLDMRIVNAFGLLATGLLAYYLWTYKDKAVIPSVGMAMIMGGAFGNLGERLFQGYVIDWISFEWPDWLFFTRWPSFNVADASINVGIGLYLIYVFFFENRSQPVKPAAPESTLDS